MTHDDLVQRAKKWLINSQGCCVIVTRRMMVANENPDALGFLTVGRSILIECKMSRADFFRDAKKFFRKYSHHGMGEYRYYLTPPGLVQRNEVPEGWGLLECHPHVIRRVQTAKHHSDKNMREEIKQLLGFIRMNDEHEMPDGLFSCVS